jgi:hypothetical protein
MLKVKPHSVNPTEDGRYLERLFTFGGHHNPDDQCGRNPNVEKLVQTGVENSTVHSITLRRPIVLWNGGENEFKANQNKTVRKMRGMGFEPKNSYETRPST